MEQKGSKKVVILPKTFLERVAVELMLYEVN